MPGESLTGTTILLVEDNENLRSLLSQFLFSYGAVVIACANLAEATDRIAIARPNLILTDISLPDGDGFQLLRIFQQLDRESGTITPALAMSARASLAMPQLAADAGFSDFLRKPFTPDRLIDAIRAALGEN